MSDDDDKKKPAITYPEKFDLQNEEWRLTEEGLSRSNVPPTPSLKVNSLSSEETARQTKITAANRRLNKIQIENLLTYKKHYVNKTQRVTQLIKLVNKNAKEPELDEDMDLQTLENYPRLSELLGEFVEYVNIMKAENIGVCEQKLLEGQETINMLEEQNKKINKNLKSIQQKVNKLKINIKHNMGLTAMRSSVNDFLKEWEEHNTEPDINYHVNAITKPVAIEAVARKQQYKNTDSEEENQDEDFNWKCKVAMKSDAKERKFKDTDSEEEKQNDITSWKEKVNDLETEIKNLKSKVRDMEENEMTEMKVKIISLEEVVEKHFELKTMVTSLLDLINEKEKRMDELEAKQTEMETEILTLRSSGNSQTSKRKRT